jgi:NADPH:quinone reductase-like Zn-dependent oxidoreductase
VEKPVAKNNEILVKVFTTTVSAADFRVRSFTVPLSFWLPARLALGLTRPRQPVLGMDFAGLVEAVGRNVNNYRVGDAVFGLVGERFGTYAQYLCFSQDWKGAALAGKPDSLSFEQAAAIPFGELVASGKIKAVIDRIYPMEQIVAAHRYVETGQKKGNVIITFNG